MADNPYAVPAEDLFDSARVPLPEQVVEQPERRFGDGAVGSVPFDVSGLECADGE